MCSGAILWSGIPEVVLGTTIHTLKKLGLPHIDLPCAEVSSRCSFGGFEVTYGMLEAECENLFAALARIRRVVSGRRWRVGDFGQGTNCF